MVSVTSWPVLKYRLEFPTTHRNHIKSKLCIDSRSGLPDMVCASHHVQRAAIDEARTPAGHPCRSFKASDDVSRSIVPTLSLQAM